VRYEAIQSLGRLPPSPAVIRALESMLGYEGLVELQYAALTSLGHIGATESGGRIAQFLDSSDALLRARAMRTLGDIRDGRYVPRIRQLLDDDPEIDCRLAAVSALGKFRDRESVAKLVYLYRQLANDDAGTAGEPRSKVVLLALAKILDREENFSREWRVEERQPGSRLPGVIARLASTVKRQGTEAAALAGQLDDSVGVASSSTVEAFAALQALAPLVRKSAHPDAPLVAAILQGTGGIAQPHRALVILLGLALRRVLMA
jgi:HEAT repeat protein